MVVMVENSDRDLGEDQEQAKVTSAYRWYVLVVLMLAYTLNFLDRQIMGILLEPIRKEFGLADWQLGVIVGVGFALIYCTLSLLVAAITETANRARMLALAVGFWSLMTAACGLAWNSWSLLAARFGVGLGEAGGSPASQSLISDIFAKHERARALSVWGLGAPFGTAIGVIGGAAVAQAYGWRTAFYAAGLPGLALAVLVYLTIRDPRPKMAAPARRLASVGPLSLSILRQPTLLIAGFGVSIGTMVSYCSVLWGPSYFIRQFDLSPLTVSWFAAVVLGGATAVGTALGGFLVHRLAPRWPSAYVDIPAIGYVLAAPLYWVALSIHDPVLSATVLLAPTILYSFSSGPIFALFQNLAPPGARAMATAVLFMMMNLIGLAIGPTLVGGLSSYFQAEYGLAGGLHRALLFIIAGLFPAAALLVWSMRVRGGAQEQEGRGE
jgi:predicted MFS family arabinose efflux permease